MLSGKCILWCGISILFVCYWSMATMDHDNSEEYSDAIEGDMLLTRKQIRMLYSEHLFRNGRIDIAAHWPNNVVPYEIDTEKYGNISLF